VVRERDRRLRDLEGAIPGHALVVDEHAHELGHGDRRVRVVELDRDLSANSA